MNWNKDITKAPKDGTQILICKTEEFNQIHRYATVFWRDYWRVPGAGLVNEKKILCWKFIDKPEDM